MTIIFEASDHLGSLELLQGDEFIAEYQSAYDPEKESQMGIPPQTPTEAKPGSDEKVLMLAARYAAGLPLWHNGDCYDHAPHLKGEFNRDEEEPRF